MLEGCKVIISAFMVDVGLKAVVATKPVIFGVKQFCNLMAQKYLFYFLYISQNEKFW